MQSDPNAMLVWKEPWKDATPLKNEVPELLQGFLCANEHWFRIHTTIYSNKKQLTPEEIYQDDKKLGFDFKQAIKAQPGQQDPPAA